MERRYATLQEKTRAWEEHTFANSGNYSRKCLLPTPDFHVPGIERTQYSVLYFWSMLILKFVNNEWICSEIYKTCKNVFMTYFKYELKYSKKVFAEMHFFFTVMNLLIQREFSACADSHDCLEYVWEGPISFLSFRVLFLQTSLRTFVQHSSESL